MAHFGGVAPWSLLERQERAWKPRQKVQTGQQEDSCGSWTKVDGVPTRDVFFLLDTKFNTPQIQWASDCAWQAGPKTLGEGAGARLQDNAVSARFMAHC